MTSRTCLAIVLGLLAVSALAGCGDEVKRISGSNFMLDLLHKQWTEARAALQGDQPDLNLLRPIELNLRGRVLRSVEKSYSGDNKQEVINALKSVTAAFRSEIMTKLEPAGRTVQLASGVTLEQLRAAFNKVDEQYRRLRAITASGASAG